MDKNPNFVKAVTDLIASACGKLNNEIKDRKNVYYQIVGLKLN